MNNLRDKINKIFNGRNGMDELNVSLIRVALVALILRIFLPIYIFQVIGLIGEGFAIYALFRAFSRNIYKRQAENRAFLDRAKKYNKYMPINLWKYKYFTCPNCGQKVRVPRGKGRIEIVCPKCKNKFEKRS